MNIQWLKLLISLLMCQLAGFIGTLFSMSSIPSWYVTLNKPAFAPPNWIFAPVWIFLYILMGISFYILWTKLDFHKFGFQMSLFIFQLILNSFWTIIFFGLKSPFYALIEIALLWIIILLCIISFYRVSKAASLLLIPYLLWVGFAMVLNFEFWKLN